MAVDLDQRQRDFVWRTELASGLRLAGWGFVFLFDLNLSVNGKKVDFLPDVVGYIMFVVGAGRLVLLDSSARVARALAIALVPFGIASIAFDLNPSHSSEPTALRWIAIALEFAMAWLLGGVVVRLGGRLGNHALMQSARTRRAAYVAFPALFWLFVRVAITRFHGTEHDVAPVVTIVIVGFVGFVTVAVLMTLLMFAAARECEGDREPSRDDVSTRAGGPPAAASSTSAD